MITLLFLLVSADKFNFLLDSVDRPASLANGNNRRSSEILPSKALDSWRHRSGKQGRNSRPRLFHNAVLVDFHLFCGVLAFERVRWQRVEDVV